MTNRIGPPSVSLSECSASSREVSIAGIVLAAGSSSRFGGKNKLLAEIDGQPLITRSVQTLIESNVDPVYVVVSDRHRRVQRIVQPLRVRVLVNEASSQGQGTSVRTGVEAVRRCSSVDAVMVSLGDMPFVSPSTIERLIATYQAGVAGIIVAGYQGQRGNPVLFDASYLESLASVSGDTGARHLIVGSDDAVLVETGDPGVLQDIDTPTDLDRFDA